MLDACHWHNVGPVIDEINKVEFEILFILCERAFRNDAQRIAFEKKKSKNRTRKLRNFTFHKWKNDFVNISLSMCTCTYVSDEFEKEFQNQMRKEKRQMSERDGGIRNVFTTEFA